MGLSQQMERRIREPQTNFSNDKFNYLLDFKDSIKNFTTYVPSDSEYLVLLLGPAMVILPDQSLREFKKWEKDFTESVRTYCRDIRLRHQFRDSVATQSDFSIPNPHYNPSGTMSEGLEAYISKSFLHHLIYASP